MYIFFSKLVFGDQLVSQFLSLKDSFLQGANNGFVYLNCFV